MKSLHILIDDEEMVLPSKYEICPRCEGRGTHDHPAFSNGITSDEWNGPDWDEDSRESYMRGNYDVMCTTCHGQRVILVPDLPRMTVEQRRAWDDKERADAEYVMACRSEQILCGDY